VAQFEEPVCEFVGAEPDGIDDLLEPLGKQDESEGVLVSYFLRAAHGWPLGSLDQTWKRSRELGDEPVRSSETYSRVAVDIFRDRS
jgi:hypothetical protein